MNGDQRRPWWYSGDDAPDDLGGESEQQGTGSDTSGASGLGDWTALLSGAVRMVDWATSAVMAPHAEHDDPSEHPTCVVCRTITLVGDPTGLVPGAGSAPSAPPAEPRTAPAITWIPIRDEETGPAR